MEEMDAHFTRTFIPLRHFLPIKALSCPITGQDNRSKTSDTQQASHQRSAPLQSQQYPSQELCIAALWLPIGAVLQQRYTTMPRKLPEPPTTQRGLKLASRLHSILCTDAELLPTARGIARHHCCVHRGVIAAWGHVSTNLRAVEGALFPCSEVYSALIGVFLWRGWEGALVGGC